MLCLLKLCWRGVTEVSWRLSFKAVWLWVFGGLIGLWAWRRRLRRGEHFPPFLFFAVTGKCPLRCRGCWIDDRREISPEIIDAAIESAATQSVFFHTLLGGEPLLYPHLWDIIARHKRCYFQIITAGQSLDSKTVAKIKKLGNVSPLVSIDGLETTNDNRRGAGTYERAIDGCRELQRQRLLYGVACVVTAENLDEVVTTEFVKQFIDLGAMYLWFYVFRPVGGSPSPELCLSAEQLVTLRTRLLALRRRMPIVLIDTYWDAEGRAVCPASRGMGYHIGPSGSIEPCPPLACCRETVYDNGGDIAKTIRDSTFLPAFGEFVRERFSSERQGCVILSHPKELAAFFRQHSATDTSGRDLISELEHADTHPSHDQSAVAGGEIAEDFWFYRILKRTLFLGMGAYG
ncbi:MAG: radical SAM/SPASM domain-containing protein [Thermoguttaceae bacterium]